MIRAIAWVDATNSPPKGSPKSCLWWRTCRQTGWTYLTPEGETMLRYASRELIAEFEQEVSSWATVAASRCAAILSATGGAQ